MPFKNKMLNLFLMHLKMSILHCQFDTQVLKKLRRNKVRYLGHTLHNRLKLCPSFKAEQKVQQYQQIPQQKDMHCCILQIFLHTRCLLLHRRHTGKEREKHANFLAAQHPISAGVQTIDMHVPSIVASKWSGKWFTRKCRTCKRHGCPGHSNRELCNQPPTGN
jgi:hypothetical protein